MDHVFVLPLSFEWNLQHFHLVAQHFSLHRTTTWWLRTWYYQSKCRPHVPIRLYAHHGPILHRLAAIQNAADNRQTDRWHSHRQHESRQMTVNKISDKELTFCGRNKQKVPAIVGSAAWSFELNQEIWFNLKFLKVYSESILSSLHRLKLFITLDLVTVQ